MFRYSLQHSPQTLLILRTELHITINVHRYSCKVPLPLSDVNETWIFFRQVFERNSNIKFHENSSSGSLVVPYGWTDGRGQAKSRFSHFCGSALEAVIKKTEIRALNVAVKCHRSFVMFKTQSPHGYSGRDFSRFYKFIPAKCFNYVTTASFHVLSILSGTNSLNQCRARWPRVLRCGSTAARLLGLTVRIPPVTWMSVSYESCLLSCRGLCVELITHPEESYRLWCVWVWLWSRDTEEVLAH